MTKRIVPLAVTFIFLLSGMAGSAAAHDKTRPVVLGPLKIEKIWSRATPKTAEVGAGYIMVTNSGAEADRLMSVVTDIAAETQFHTMSMTDGVMKMRPIEGGVVIPANGRAVLRPGRDHLMFMGLKAPIEKGKPFKATLTFEKAGTVEVTFRTVGIGENPGHAGH